MELQRDATVGQTSDSNGTNKLMYTAFLSKNYYEMYPGKVGVLIS